MGSRPFQSTVPFYVAHRPRYPRELLDAVATVLGLDGRGRLLDLGCGPGFLAIAFAARFEEVVAMDPEPAMLDAARAEAGAAPARVTFVLGGSDDLGPHLGRFRVVVMGRSFHWMAQDRTLAALDRVITPRGTVALFHVENPDVPENAWRGPWDAVRKRYAPEAPSTRSGDARHDTVLRRSAFAAVTRLSHRWRQRSPVDDLVGRALSLSATSPVALGAARPAFEADLRQALAPFAERGSVEEVLSAEALLAGRPGEAEGPTCRG